VTGAVLLCDTLQRASGHNLVMGLMTGPEVPSEGVGGLASRHGLVTQITSQWAKLHMLANMHSDHASKGQHKQLETTVE